MNSRTNTQRYSIDFLKVKWLTILMICFISPLQLIAVEPADTFLINKYKQTVVKYSNENLDSTLYYLNLLKDIPLEYKDEVRLYLDLGNSFFHKGNMYLATQNYLKISDLGTEHNDPLITSAGDISMASVYLHKEEYRKALNILKKAENLLLKMQVSSDEELNEKESFLITVYINISNANIKLDNYLEAEQYIEKAIALCLQKGDELNEAIAYANKSSILAAQNYQSALKYAYKALKIRTQLDNHIELTKSYHSLGELYYERNQSDSALLYLEKTFDNANKLGLLFIKYHSAELLSDIYEKERSFEKAHHYAKLSHNAYIKYLEDSNLSIINDLRMENEIAHIKSEEQERRSKLFNTIWILVLLLLSIIALFINQNRKSRVKRLENERLSLEKQNVEESLEDKNKKLVTNVLSQISRNELIARAIDKLQAFSVDLNMKQTRSLNQIINELKAGNDKTILKEFELTFQEVHTQFFEKLDKQYSLTPAERRMAAFIKLNLSSKEISAISGQSIRTIDVTRYRLRKKLDITNTEINLRTFLAKL